MRRTGVIIAVLALVALLTAAAPAGSMSLYVVYGTAVSYGIDMAPVFREVHRSNMSKIGGYKRGDGKWVKPTTYSPAAVEPILAEQRSHLTQQRESSAVREQAEPRG